MLQFRKSLAAVSVAAFVLGLGDRHNDNIMLTGSFFRPCVIGKGGEDARARLQVYSL